MTLLIASEGPDDYEEPETFDFSSPEDVIFQVVAGGNERGEWAGFTVEWADVLNEKDGITGAARYEVAYGSGLEFLITEHVDCPKAEGWFVMQSVTATYNKGDGWSSDDDMDFYHEDIRPATQEEIDRVGGQ